MQYPVRCQCGRDTPVRAAQAGGTVVCSCGASLTVPSLVALKRSVGETTVSVLERIRVKIYDGDLPENTICPITGGRPDAVFFFRIVCERIMLPPNPIDPGTRLVSMFLPRVVRFAFEASRPWEQVGVVAVDAPLRIASAAVERIAGMTSQHEFKSILAITPLYAQLFAQYPFAEVTPLPPAPIG